MMLAVTDEEARVLDEVLDAQLAEMRVELARTDDRAFRSDLRDRYDHLERVRSAPGFGRRHRRSLRLGSRSSDRQERARHRRIIGGWVRFVARFSSLPSGWSGASAFAAPPRKLGPWGEDPAVVPDYAPTEERRAPKLYDNTRIFARLPSRATRPASTTCCSSVTPTCAAAGTSSAAPTSPCRFVLGKEPPIKLWGPEDHSDFYVSIPRVHLRRGEPRRGDGVGPRRHQGRIHRRRPRPLRRPPAAARDLALVRSRLQRRRGRRGAHARAPASRPHRRALAAFEAAQPDAAGCDYGRPSSDSAIKGHFYVGTMRYAAGAIGWDHPEVRARVERLAAADDRVDRAARPCAAALVAGRRAPGVADRGVRRALHRAALGLRRTKPSRSLEPMPSAECAVVVSVATSPDRPLACSPRRASAASASPPSIVKGDFHAARAPVRRPPSSRPASSSSPSAATRSPGSGSATAKKRSLATASSSTREIRRRRRGRT